MSLDKRLRRLIEEERLRRLRRKAEISRAPVGSIVRDAIDDHLSIGDETSRRVAFRALLEEPTPEGREPDWDVVKAEMRDRWGAARLDPG